MISLQSCIAMRDGTSWGESRRGMRGEGRTRHNSQRADPRRSVCGRGAAPQPHPQPYSPHADARILKPHSAHTALQRARPAAAFSFAISFLRAVSSFNGAVSGMAARLECPLTEHLHSFRPRAAVPRDGLRARCRYEYEGPLGATRRCRFKFKYSFTITKCSNKYVWNSDWARSGATGFRPNIWRVPAAPPAARADAQWYWLLVTIHYDLTE